MSYEYDKYLAEHVSNVQKGYQWFKENLPEVVEDLTSKGILMSLHDDSKILPDEYDAYDAYFYGGNKSFEVVQAFNLAWLKHIHRNPHHWQRWVLINDDPEEGDVALDMPLPYVIEMICDWWSFSWKTGKLNEIFAWYEERRNRIKFSEPTRVLVEGILDDMKQRLKELESDPYAN